VAQNAERAKAILQIRKLREQTTDQGRTESEAMIAMDRMQKLIAVYNIGLDEVFLSTEPCIQITVTNGKIKDNGIGTIVVGLGKMFDMVVYRKKSAEMCTYVFFGLESDVLAAEYLFNILNKSLILETTRHRNAFKSFAIRGAKKSAGASFAKGMSLRIYYRLLALGDQTRRETVEQQGSNAIIKLKDNRVQDEFKKQSGVKLRKNYQQSHGVSNSSSYSAGAAAGDRVNLNRPVGSSAGGFTMGLLK
jgi:hypothetical protein